MPNTFIDDLNNELVVLGFYFYSVFHNKVQVPASDIMIVLEDKLNIVPEYLLNTDNLQDISPQAQKEMLLFLKRLKRYFILQFSMAPIDATNGLQNTRRLIKLFIVNFIEHYAEQPEVIKNKLIRERAGKDVLIYALIIINDQTLWTKAQKLFTEEYDQLAFQWLTGCIYQHQQMVALTKFQALDQETQAKIPIIIVSLMTFKIECDLLNQKSNTDSVLAERHLYNTELLNATKVYNLARKLLTNSDNIRLLGLNFIDAWILPIQAKVPFINEDLLKNQYWEAIVDLLLKIKSCGPKDLRFLLLQIYTGMSAQMLKAKKNPKLEVIPFDELTLDMQYFLATYFDLLIKERLFKEALELLPVFKLIDYSTLETPHLFNSFCLKNKKPNPVNELMQLIQYFANFEASLNKPASLPSSLKNKLLGPKSVAYFTDAVRHFLDQLFAKMPLNPDFQEHHAFIKIYESIKYILIESEQTKYNNLFQLNTFLAKQCNDKSITQKPSESTTSTQGKNTSAPKKSDSENALTKVVLVITF